MLQEVKELQEKAVAELVECIAKKDELIFKAPTALERHSLWPNLWM